MGDFKGNEGESGLRLLDGSGLVSWPEPLSILMLILLAVENRF